jgi:PAS domain S-box-containing protein
MALCLDSSIVEPASFPEMHKSKQSASVWNVATTETLPDWNLLGLDGTEVFDDDESEDGDCLLVDRDEELSLLAELTGKLQLHGNELIFRLDANGLVKEWNDKAVELTSFHREDIVGRDFQDFVSMFIAFESQQALRDVLQKALMGQETTDFAFPLYALDARCIQVLLTTVTRRNDAGEIVGAFCVGKHVTGDNLQLQGNELIFGIDACGLISEWNSNAVELTSFEKEDVVGRHVDDFVDMFITVDIRNSLQAVLQKTLMGQETVDFAFPLFTLDARCLQMLMTTVTRRNEFGEIVGAICIGKDVTGQKMD